MSYESRPEEYDPATACASHGKFTLGNCEFDLKCDLAKEHDGDKCRKILPGDIVIYWPKAEKD